MGRFAFSNLKLRVITGVILAVLAIWGLVWAPVWGFLMYLLVGLTIFELVWATSRPDVYVSMQAAFFSGLLLAVAGLALVTAATIRYEAGGTGVIIILLVATAVADIAGLVFGKQFGKKKFAPAISPKKTWAGVWGSVVLGGLAAAIAWLAAEQYTTTGLNGLEITAIALALPWVAICGDLLASWPKRLMELDDWGKIFPGHGGIFDRLDSHYGVFALFGVIQPLLL